LFDGEVIPTVQDAIVPVHDGSAPPIETVAVTGRPSETSTVIFDVPWPLRIFPAETFQV